MTRVAIAAATLALVLTPPGASAWAQAPRAGPTAARAPVPVPAAAPIRLLFVGNSFTQGSGSAARDWRPDTVTELAGERIGGVPALFKRFADQLGLDYRVSSVTRGGSTLARHLAERRALIDQPWDVVVLQEYSTLDPDRPGDGAATARDVPIIADLLAARNPTVRLYLTATWSRADLVYGGASPWTGRPVAEMADSLRAEVDRVRVATPRVNGVIPVGQAWNRAFATAVADPNPYNGISPGQLGLWADDHYHASVAGYYLEALMVFGQVTGIDPLRLGAAETAARELGLSAKAARALQKVASDQLAAERGRRR